MTVPIERDQLRRESGAVTRSLHKTRGDSFQWIHVAHGHLDTSPAWEGQRPTAAQRAYYRRFEGSLDEGQRRELRSAFYKRA